MADLMVAKNIRPPDRRLPIVGMLSNPVEWKDDPCGRTGFRTKVTRGMPAGVELLEIELSRENLKLVSEKQPVKCLKSDGGKILPISVPFQEIGAIYDFYLYGEPSCGKENDSFYLSMNQLLEKSGKPFIDYLSMIELCGDKWKSHLAMENLGVPVPKTKLYSAPAVESLLGNAGFVFLKKRMGYEGDGQIVLRREGTGYVASNNGTKMKFENVACLLSYLDGNSLDESWIAQEGKEVIRIDGRVLDFRVIFQRGCDGTLCETATYARVGAEGAYQSNIGTAPGKKGAADDPKRILADWSTIKNGVISIGEQGVFAIETETGKLVGEIGVDIMLLKDGTLYFIEANTRLGHVGLTTLSEKIGGAWTAALQNYFIRPLEYAKWLMQRSS
ncbi:YheC/D like ATP-grasp [uncultured archaeon]|nr:YheC/D like ATP-grasp [uncultured archaeon]